MFNVYLLGYCQLRDLTPNFVTDLPILYQFYSLLNVTVNLAQHQKIKFNTNMKHIFIPKILKKHIFLNNYFKKLHCAIGTPFFSGFRPPPALLHVFRLCALPPHSIAVVSIIYSPYYSLGGLFFVCLLAHPLVKVPYAHKKFYIVVDAYRTRMLNGEH